MEMTAIHAIYRKENGKQVRVAPGSPFTCPEDEGNTYLKMGAATKNETVTKAAPAKAAKAATKAAPAKAKKAASEEAPKAAAEPDTSTEETLLDD